MCPTWPPICHLPSALRTAQGLIPDAVAAYRTVLRTVEDNKGAVHVDPMQKLHALHNLAQMLASSAARQEVGTQVSGGMYLYIIYGV